MKSSLVHPLSPQVLVTFWETFQVNAIVFENSRSQGTSLGTHLTLFLGKVRSTVGLSLAFGMSWLNSIISLGFGLSSNIIAAQMIFGAVKFQDKSNVF